MREELRQALNTAREQPNTGCVECTSCQGHAECNSNGVMSKKLYEHFADLAVGEIEKQIALTKAYHDKWDEITDKYLESQSRIDLLKQAMRKAIEKCNNCENSYIIADILQQALDGKEEGK